MAPFPTLGRDCSLVLMWVGERIDMEVSGFQSRQVVERLRHHPLNSDPIELVTPKGWEGEFQLDRRGPTVERLFYLIETAFRTGGGSPWSTVTSVTTGKDPTTGQPTTRSYGTSSPGTLYQYVTERDGSLSTYEFGGVSIVLEDAGRYQTQDIVRQRVSFFASYRNQL